MTRLSCILFCILVSFASAEKVFAQDVTVTKDDWNACLTYQAKFSEHREVISRLSVDLEREKHAASHCAGLNAALQDEVNRARNSTKVVEAPRPLAMLFVAIGGGAAATAGAFLISDYSVAGGILIGVGAAGIIFTGVWW